MSMPSLILQEPRSSAGTAASTLSRVTENIRISETTANLSRKFAQQRDAVVGALSNPDFYVQLLFVGCALALAWLMALLIRRRLRKYFEDRPPHHIGMELLSRSQPFFSGFLALLYLSVVKPFADDFSGGYSLASAMMQMTLAYMLAKVVRLTVQTRPVANLIAFIILATAALKVTAFEAVTAGYLNAVALDIGSFHISLLNLVNSVIILIIVFWLAGMMSRSLEKFLRRTSSLSYTTRELTVKFFRILFYFLALLITLSVLGVDLTAFAVFGGALGVGIGLGLQKITANFVSGITLLLEKSIKIGDLIEVANTTGVVRELNIRYALIEAVDGREVLIPNEELVSTRVTNWTYSNSHARVEITVGVNYDADVQLARRLLLEAAAEHPKTMKKPEPACFLREFADSSLKFMLVFWIADVHDGRYAPQSDVMMSVLAKFRKHDIDIPFPQRVTRVISDRGEPGSSAPVDA